MAEARASLSAEDLWRGSLISTIATESGRLALNPPSAKPAASPFRAAPTTITSKGVFMSSSETLLSSLRQASHRNCIKVKQNQKYA
jgi:hypothetical protein